MYECSYNIQSSQRLFHHTSMATSNLASFFLAPQLQHHQDLFKEKIGLVREISELHAVPGKVKGKVTE